MKRPRIWELDALRGLCILAVVAVHFIYDLVDASVLDHSCLYVQEDGSWRFGHAQ